MKIKDKRVRVLGIGRKGEEFWLLCEDGCVYRFEDDDPGLYFDVKAWVEEQE